MLHLKHTDGRASNSQVTLFPGGFCAHLSLTWAAMLWMYLDPGTCGLHHITSCNTVWQGSCLAFMPPKPEVFFPYPTYAQICPASPPHPTVSRQGGITCAPALDLIWYSSHTLLNQQCHVQPDHTWYVNQIDSPQAAIHIHV